MESTDSSSGSQQPQLPPGFRFHPTDEELVVHYLKKKAAAAPLPVAIIADIDLYKFDPWELPAKAVFGEQEWYFFSPRDRKYPNGARPNRAATSGYWKATGTDKAVLTAGGTTKVGVKKALVFYGGKPPKGIKTNWIMHEYRLADNKPISSKPDFTNKKGCSLRLDDWVLCRIYKKHNTARPVDRDHDDVIGSIPTTLSMPVGQQHRIINLENHHDQSSLYELGLMNDHGMNSSCHLGSNKATASPPVHNMLPPTKRMLPGSYWDDERNSNSNTKRFLSENFDGRSDDQNSNSIATILGQLPQNPSMQPLGSLGDGVFGQQPYHVPGMNWYS